MQAEAVGRVEDHAPHLLETSSFETPVAVLSGTQHSQARRSAFTSPLYTYRKVGSDGRETWPRLQHQALTCTFKLCHVVGTPT